MEKKVEKLLEERGQNIKEEWIDMIEDKMSICESPMEKLFLIEWYYQNDNFYFGGDLRNYIITPQYKIDNYRVDFLICLDDGSITPHNNKENCLIVEIDSYLWHGSDPEQFTKEKERERELIKQEYKLMRFSGREIYRNVEKCVNETMGYCLTKK
jgi:very-short-patch-repair endonuclease